MNPATRLTEDVLPDTVTRNSIGFTTDKSTLLDAPVERLLQLKDVFGHGQAFDVWETPEMWLPPSSRLAHRRSSNLRSRITSYISVLPPEASIDFLDQVVLLGTRYLLMLRVGPASLGMRSRFNSLDASTISGMAYKALPELLAFGCTSTIQSSDYSGANVLQYVDVAALRTRGDNSAAEMLKEIERMKMLHQRGLWLEVPEERKAGIVPLLNSAAPITNRTKDSDPHLPLPDSYTAQMGSSSLWLSNNISDCLVEVCQLIGKQWDAFFLRNGRPPSRCVEGRIFRKVLKHYKWTDAAGKPISELPFFYRPPKEGHIQIRANARRENSLGPAWTPKNLRELKHLIGTVQTAHYFIVGLSIGPRASEALSLERNCVRYSPRGTPFATGLTFKLVENFEGEERDWPIPDAAVTAVERQSRLIRAAESLLGAVEWGIATGEVREEANLWGQIGAQSRDSTEPLVRINARLQNYALTLGMDVNPGGQNIRSHRFRKTLARLVALALTQSPEILKDIFGHKSIDMTLYYILSDPSLRAEIETVTRELRVLMAKTAVEKMLATEVEQTTSGFGGYGGRAAATISSSIEVHRARLHRRGKDWGSETAYELAELLTMKGDSWECVRPGVICTKLPGEVGICNLKRGRPDASRCGSDCDHRLEEDFLRVDVDGAIKACITNFNKCEAEGEHLVAAHWAMQIRSHVPRLSDLQAKWLSDPTVSRVMSTAD
ncbi:hypothetical protein [Pseudorhodoferax sp. Leaf267]|uniref:hypothetical protein n=1 Tax=Pseudorhodoferax sp. Leaf267 TaxID=1736316 RepID=UPI000B2139DC|nr:hypothetical protein [Pseudorhodoferax sp. Leaf267]